MTWFFFAVLALAVIGTTLRLHLVFSSRFDRGFLVHQRVRAEPWLRCVDAAMIVVWLAAAAAMTTEITGLIVD